MDYRVFWVYSCPYFIWDSKTINEAKSMIMNSLVHIQEQCEGNIPQQYVDEYKKLAKEKKGIKGSKK